MGDRAYSTARGIHYIFTKGGHIVARCNIGNIRLCDRNGKTVALYKWKDQIPKAGAAFWDLLVPVPPEDENGKVAAGWSLKKAVAWVPVRVVAARTLTGEIIWIISTLPEDVITPDQLLELYRIRWQIELVFKRLKSLMDLDELQSGQQGPTSKSWIYAKLLAAALAQKLLMPDEAFSPWGYPVKVEKMHD